jgi:hypothetical protein
MSLENTKKKIVKILGVKKVILDEKVLGDLKIGIGKIYGEDAILLGIEKKGILPGNWGIPFVIGFNNEGVRWTTGGYTINSPNLEKALSSSGAVSCLNTGEDAVMEAIKSGDINMVITLFMNMWGGVE